MSVPWGRTIWMLHHVNHGGALEVQYPLRSATKGVRAGLRVAAAMWVALKLEGLGFPLPTRPKWHMSTWAPYRSSPRQQTLHRGRAHLAVQQGGSSSILPTTGVRAQAHSR